MKELAPVRIPANDGALPNGTNAAIFALRFVAFGNDGCCVVEKVAVCATGFRKQWSRIELRFGLSKASLL